MNIAVCVKQTPDTTTKVTIAGDGKSVADDGIQWIINPYDEFAIEEALKLTEKNGGEVTIVTLGSASAEKTIREALAMGAHKAVRINVERVPDDPLVTAKALAETLKDGNFDLIFLGRQAIDDDHGQMPQLVATALDLPCVTVVIGLEIDGSSGTATREIEGGSERVSFGLPAVIGANRKLNEPRYRSLKGIMQAKKKSIDVKEVSLTAPKMVIEKIAYPPAKDAGKIFTNGAEDAAEVVRLLREEAKVI
ncbi:MAG: electron transfer flavoprotein subunit beta/FixA family protein [Calditrichia bacterium]|nr:electron transfer flavoprotein subunit beta/FixA family protein [Calditrichota bacterium]MCB0268860.1 electron transfer flavoprotein subunit beta/FixA family protein [Calditrichota bacterium]MCB0287796.1 electron transfer flavoprotein subunit beta/FixA family protein [Calditrichota bacterium]MCB9069512.1 electron transfer flavoprotein subunit beta/FixA family protein [Calditrichia bacterium]